MTATNPKINIYATATCGDCIRSKRFLDEHRFHYTFHDIGSRPELAEFVREINARLGVSKLTRIPIIAIDDHYLSEPTDEELAAALAIEF
jgi:glutaredoxin